MLCRSCSAIAFPSITTAVNGHPLRSDAGIVP